MLGLDQLSTTQLADLIRSGGSSRAWIAAPRNGEPRTSGKHLDPLAQAILSLEDWADHSALFLEVAGDSGALFGAFLHDVRRGQAQGGLRRWPYESAHAFIADGLRLSHGMGRKCALAGLDWGGGKGLIAAGHEHGPAGTHALRESPASRELIYTEYARFVTSLRGCYITAKDAGTTPADMAVLARHTRFATCVPEQVGGSGNPSAMTAQGVVVAIEAALDHLGMGGVGDRTFAMQGGGNVAAFMIEILVAKGAREILVADISAAQAEALRDRFADAPVHVLHVRSGDDSILSRPCDVLIPNALGGTLNPKTIPEIKARLVCGAANNQLARGVRDAAALRDRQITWVPDYLANRMGIVACANEHAGSLPNDPAILQHLDTRFPGSIQRQTQDLLSDAHAQNITTIEAADRMADTAAAIPHPLWPGRTQAIIDALTQGGWERG